MNIIYEIPEGNQKLKKLFLCFQNEGFDPQLSGGRQIEKEKSQRESLQEKKLTENLD